MNTQVTEIQLFDSNDKPSGLGRIWESRPGKFSWAHPGGPEGISDSFEAAVAELEEIAAEA